MVAPKPRGLMIASRLILEILIDLGSLNPGSFRVTREYQCKLNRLYQLVKNGCLIYLKCQVRMMVGDDRFRFKWWALFGVATVAFTIFLDYTIVNTALPFIQTAPKANILQLQWVTNIYAIVLGMTMIAVGKIADTWGRKKTFYLGACIFAAAAFGAGCSSHIAIVVFFRGIQAIGSSIIFISSFALLSDLFPESERVRAISIFCGVTGFGLMVGPFLGGVLIQLLGWRWVFWIDLPLIAVGLCMCSWSLKTETQKNHSLKIDWWGLLLLVVGLGTLMYGIIEGVQSHWSYLAAWIFFGIGVSALILLIIIDERRQYPLLNFHIFKEKLIILVALSCALAGVVSTVFMFFDPLYLRTLRKLSPFLVGLLIAVIPSAQALISFFFDRLVKVFGTVNLLFFSILAAVFAMALHRALHTQTPLLFVILPFFFLGINWGLSNSVMITAVNQVIAPREIGAAIGTISTIWNITGSILLAASAAVFHSVEIQTSFLTAFHRAMSLNIAFAGIILAFAIWVYTRLKQSNKPHQL